MADKPFGHALSLLDAIAIDNNSDRRKKIDEITENLGKYLIRYLYPYSAIESGFDRFKTKENVLNAEKEWMATQLQDLTIDNAIERMDETLAKPGLEKIGFNYLIQKYVVKKIAEKMAEDYQNMVKYADCPPTKAEIAGCMRRVEDFLVSKKEE